MTFGQKYALDPVHPAKKLFTKKNGVKMINVVTKTVISQYAKGEPFVAVATIIHEKQEYYIDADALRNQTPNGVRIQDLVDSQVQYEDPLSPAEPRGLLNGFRRGFGRIINKKG
jgi:hypothetical protein